MATTTDPGPGPTPPPDPAPRTGMSTGAKVLVGCLVALVLVGVALAAAIGLGGIALKRQLDGVLGGLEQQQEASETLERLAEEHPFEVPEDGVVGEDRLERFLTVTRGSWEEIRPWADELAELREIDAASGDESGIGEVLDGLRALGGFGRARLVLAGELEAGEMSLAEYVWTGLSLRRAVEEPDAAPAENVGLVRQNEGRLPRFGEGDEPGPGTVLAVATVWGVMDLSAWEALGLDTLAAR